MASKCRLTDADAPGRRHCDDCTGEPHPEATCLHVYAG